MIALFDWLRDCRRSSGEATLTITRLLSDRARRRDPELGPLLEAAGLDLAGVEAALAPLLAAGADGSEPFLTATLMTHPTLTGLGLVGRLCEPEGRALPAMRVLSEAGLDLDALARALTGAPRELPRRPAPRPSRARAEADCPWLTDLREAADSGAFDDLEERDELRELQALLLRSYTPNVVITGRAGAGKSALVFSLARALSRGRVPEPLREHQLFSLDLGHCLANTRYRGEFEERLLGAFTRMEDRRPAILFIDELHLLHGAGRAEGSAIDAANLLKPLLAEGLVQVVGATTAEEYQRNLATDRALSRRFHRLELPEPTAEQVERMVARKAERLAEHHGLALSPEVVRATISLTNEHLPEQAQPHKTVALLDACAAQRRLREGSGPSGAALSVGDVRRELARLCGVDALDLERDQRHRVRGLSARLERHIHGQRRALEAVSSTLAYRVQALGAERRNLGTFLFSGPPGVGKTATGRAIAIELFGAPAALLTVGLAEYAAPGTESKLLGAPPGTLGSDREGVLATWLREHRRGVLLFDEVEKAHESVRLALLGLLDEGRLTTARGDRLDTRACVVVLTTNRVSRARAPVGFATAPPLTGGQSLEGFPAEFLDRLDAVIPFAPLAEDSLRAVLQEELRAGLSRLFRARGLRVEADEAGVAEVLRRRLSPGSGARGAARLVEVEILEPLAQSLLELEPGAPEGLRLVIEAPSAPRGGALAIRLVSAGAHALKAFDPRPARPGRGPRARS